MDSDCNSDIDIGSDSDEYNIYYYDNDMSLIKKSSIQIYSKDDILIGFCDYKRYQWYIKKGLATILNQNEHTISIKLNFVHKQYDNEKTLIYRKTECHCCGSKKNLQKFHVLPSHYKKYYPDEKKRYNISDILLICKLCSPNAYHFMNKFQDKLYKLLSVNPNEFIDTTKKNIKLYALSLYRKKEKDDKYFDMMTKLKHLLSIEDKQDLTKKELEYYKSLDCSKEKDGCNSISEYVVKKFSMNNKLDYLTNKWKESFILCIEPKYLPSDFITSLINSSDAEIQQYLIKYAFIT
jgi:hypothetical protein